jgi:hypothetical protein
MHVVLEYSALNESGYGFTTVIIVISDESPAVPGYRNGPIYSKYFAAQRRAVIPPIPYDYA